LRPLALAWSRRQEFAADAFAARNAGPRDLARALVKLHERNAETLAPDRIWSIFHDSHPPLGRRVARIPVE
jgi:STE24 endopeptidase